MPTYDENKRKMLDRRRRITAKSKAKSKVKSKAKNRIKREQCPDCGGGGYHLSMISDSTYGCETCKGRKTITKKILDLYNARLVLTALIKKGDRL